MADSEKKKHLQISGCTFFTDKGCTDKVASWVMDSGKFNVTYFEDDRHMTVDITKAGLDKNNGSSVNTNDVIYAGYSNYTLWVTYSDTINYDASFIYGDSVMTIRLS